MNENNEDTQQPVDADNSTRAAATSDLSRKLVVADPASHQAKSGNDRLPGLNQHENDILSKLTATPTAEPEVIRELIVPDANDKNDQVN